jgi:hypothetical protein
MVVSGALGLLHPVQDVVTVLDIHVVELTDTLFLDTSHFRSLLQNAQGLVSGTYHRQTDHAE